MILINGREMPTDAGSSPEMELVAQLRGDMLAQRGSLILEIANPDGTHSNSFTIPIQ